MIKDNGGTHNTGDAVPKPMTQHRLQAYYLAEHGQNPAILATPEDVDALIETLRTDPAVDDVANLYPLSQPLLSDGLPGRQLRVGIDGYLGVGVLSFGDAETGLLVSVGSPGSRKGVAYTMVGHRTEFPDHSEVPIDLVRRAVQEFLANGGERPTCIQWQEENYD
jgi:hypothetical protein